MLLPPIGKIVVLPERVKKAITMPKNTGATNLDAIHNGSWCYVSPVTATCSEKSFRAELTAAFDPCLVPHQTVESYTEASARRLGDTFPHQ